MISSILFDFGGVLTEGGKTGSIREMFAEVYGVAPGKVALDSSVEAAFRGTITDEAFIAAINACNPGYPPATTSILTDGADFYKRCAPVYDLAARLQKAGIQTGIFSNVFAASATALQRDGYYDGFTPLFLSCALHLLKPEAAAYDYVLQQLGVPAQEVLFIDDKDDFLAPARVAGMHTILAVSPEQIVHDVMALMTAENNIVL